MRRSRSLASGAIRTWTLRSNCGRTRPANESRTTMTITHGPITPSQGHDAVPPSDDWVPRFGVTERLTHWWTMLMIATALLTGAGLGDNGGGPLLIAHVLAVALLGVGLVVAMLVGDR